MDQRLINHATQTMEVGSKSFASACKLFDTSTRRNTLMLYTWCRHCDDVIDGQHRGFAVSASGDAPERRLDQLRNLTRRAFGGAPMEQLAFAAFQEVALAQNITEQLAFDHLEGYAMDVRGETYHTLDDTLRYCYHVAGVVGLMMAQVIGVRDNAVLDHACDLGLAFQLTNIARDIIEDAQLGRCYLPSSWLAEAGVNMKNYAKPSHRLALATVARRLVAAAEPYYHSAQAGLVGLPLRSSWAVATACGVYREIGVKVHNAGEHAWDKRQGTSKLQKISLLISAARLAIFSRIAQKKPRPAELWQRPR